MEPDDWREFSATQIGTALAHIETMPESVRRILVEAWSDTGGWRMVYADHRGYAMKQIAHVIRGRRFRLRGVADTREEHMPPPSNR